ncbi:MAG: DUF4440 domain-containing protein [Chthoniobacterales bacterium]
MKVTPLCFLVGLITAVAVCPAVAQDAAAPSRRSSPTPSEQSATPAPSVTPEPARARETRQPTPVPTIEQTPAPTPAAQPPESTPAADFAPTAPAETPSGTARPSGRKVLREKPVRAVEPRAAWTKPRPGDEPVEIRSGSKPTFDISTLGEGGVRGTIRGLEQRWQTAIREHDVAVIDELVATDFVGTSSNGQTGSKSTLLSEMRRDKNEYKSADTRSLSVRTEGDNVAVVTGIARESGTTESGQRFSNSRRFTDTWVKRKGKWRCIASATTQIPKR